MVSEGAVYPHRGVGVGKISRNIGIPPSRVIRGLRILRWFGLVSRNIDPRRKRYSTWSISRIADALGGPSGIVDFLYGGVVLDGGLAFYEWIDFFFDNYFVSGTISLLLNGLSWNDVMPSGILLVVDRKMRNQFRKFYRFYRETPLAEKYRIDVVFVSSLEECDYSIVRMENSAIPIASIEQALVDSIINYDSWGVDILETLSILIGIILPQAFEWKEKGRIRHMINLAEKQYDHKKYGFLIAVLKSILMRYYIYFEEMEALRLYMDIPEVPEDYTLQPDISRKIHEAFRTTILGDRVAMHLGLEPDFSKTRPSPLPDHILAVSEI